MITTNSGRSIAGWPFEMDIEGMHCKTVINKKYIFAALLNYVAKFLHTKLYGVYFEVIILLFGNGLPGFAAVTYF